MLPRSELFGATAELRKLAVQLGKTEPEEKRNLNALGVVLDQRVAPGDQSFECNARRTQQLEEGRDAEGVR